MLGKIEFTYKQWKQICIKLSPILIQTFWKKNWKTVSQTKST